MKEKTGWPLCCLWSGPMLLGQNLLHTEPRPGIFLCAPGLTPVARSVISNKPMRLSPLPALAGTARTLPVLRGGWWFLAAWLWEVPALLSLGTHPEMQTRHLPSAWEAPVSLEQRKQRQGHCLSDSDHGSLAGVPASSLCLVFHACAFSTFWKQGKRKTSKETWGTRGWKRTLKYLDGLSVRTNGRTGQEEEQQVRGWARQDPGLHSSSQGLPGGGLSRDLSPFGGKFRHLAVEFLAQPLMSLGPLSF